MTDVAKHMAVIGISDRLEMMILELSRAVVDGDMPRIASADHALRNGAMSLIAGLELSDTHAPMALEILQDVLTALRKAAADLAQPTSRSQANLVYLQAVRKRHGAGN